MRICVVGHHVQRPDEGVRQIAYHLARQLATGHEVKRANVANVSCWSDIRTFQPHVIHFVLSPTLQGLLAAKMLSLAHRAAVTVVSAPHPRVPALGKLASALRPDLILVQARDSEARFQSMGWTTKFLPNGVDSRVFVSATGHVKEQLRETYGIPLDRFVVLHVGPVSKTRNVQALAELQRPDSQVLVVGRPSERGDSDLVAFLRERRCLVWLDYFPNLSEVYALSDCYVFPTRSRRHCIEMPLSVLEAMSCNLPVVATPFGALPRALEEGAGLLYTSDEESLAKAVETVKAGIETRTRDKVLRYDWASVVHHLEPVYAALVAARNSGEGRLSFE
jgi:glycosyltransferase involved in cell wall biosynthesis